MEDAESETQCDNELEEDGNSDLSNQGDESKKKEEIKKHLLFSYRSIAVIASSIGISSVSQDVCQHITEELYFRTKELINMSKTILIQNKCSTLTTCDVKKAMNLLGGVEVYGQSSTDELNFEYIPNADLFVEENSEIEIDEERLSDSLYTIKKEPYIRGGWVMPEGYFEDPSIISACSYYHTIAKTILSGSPAHLRVALSDLRTNPKIGPICPYFLNLVALTVKSIPCDIHLTNALIGTVHAIAHNRFVDPSPYSAVNEAVNSLLKIVIEGNVRKIGEDFDDNDDDLTLRMRAGILLAKVVMMWSIELKQQIIIVRKLLQHLVNPSVPLQAHYGAIVALTTLGHKRLDYFWPIVEKFLALLGPKIESKKNETMVLHVMTAILVAARNFYKKEQGSNPEQLRKLYEVDKMLYSSFGDSVTPLRLVTSPPVFKCEKTSVQQSSLKLRICWTKPKVDKMFMWPDPGSRMFYHSPLSENAFASTSGKINVPYFCVKRNYKYCQPVHQRSASGDLLLIL